eukprot:GHVP01057459.1.p1 GENE.GHVP01057459.1~~GHVP01057459.1.p1  ORF type:complete len:149 (-),score=15.17 GHVP01057459.1:379-825(-)
MSWKGKKLVYLQQSTLSVKEHEVDQVSIDTSDSEVTLDTVSDMADIFLGKVNKLYIYNKALYLLPKIKSVDMHEIDQVSIDTENSDLTLDTVSDMVDIFLGKVKDLLIRNKAFYLLPKIKPVDGHEIDQVSINTSDLKVTLDTVSDME